MAAVQSAQRGNHILGHFAFIKPLAPLGRHPPQHLGLTRRAEDLTDAGYLAVQEIIAPRIAGQRLGILRPVKGHAGGHRNPLICIINRRGQHAVQPHAPPIRRQGAKGVHRAGQGHRINPAQRHRRQLPLPQGRRRHRRRSPTRAIQRENFFRPGRLDQHETIAANPGHLRLAYPQQHRARNRRIHRIAAGLQDVNRDLGRQRMRGGAHAIAGIGGGPAGHVEIAHGKLPFGPTLGGMAGISKQRIAEK